MNKINRVMVANRGEIAVRIIRTLNEMGIESVAIYSKADEDALFVQLADKAVCVGENKSATSYLNMDNVISAAIETKCDAIHPGSGFLSEKEEFVKMCESHDLIFIGPSSETIKLMGDKINARELMIKNNVRVVPGSGGVIKNYTHAKTLVKKIGYPILLKASAGGGGKGIRVVNKDSELESSFNNVKLEAKLAFNDESIFMEKYIKDPKHIEVQILADENNTIHLFDRNCSMQRNNQKSIEEAPAMNLGLRIKNEMLQQAVQAAKACNYINAGTVEFIVDKDENFYFIEMNTRIQVEHPVTEMITGVDLIREQILIADGQGISFEQKDIKVNGHSIEVRVNAEDPYNNFAPSIGVISFANIPDGLGVRNDNAYYVGWKIPIYYDSMIGKLIVHGKTREIAINRMRRALEEYVIQGIKTNLDFSYELINTKEFKNCSYTTSTIKNFLKTLKSGGSK